MNDYILKFAGFLNITYFFLVDNKSCCNFITMLISHETKT